MNQTQWTAIDTWFSELLAPEDGALSQALRQSEAAGLPSINVTANQGKFLHLLARIAGAKRILEIGTLGGYSTIWLGRALPANGELISLELSPEYAAMARAHIDAAGLANIVNIIQGKAVDSLRQLIADQTPAFDLIFIDADKENNPLYLELSLLLARPGTVIIGDNVVRQGRVLDPALADVGVRGMHQFIKMLAGPGLSSTAIQTVGAKGWDGFSITIVGNV